MVATYFWLDVTDEDDDRHLVALSGELDLAQADQLRRALVRVAGSTVIVDLGGLTFIDAAGIGALLAARAEILASGNGFELRGATQAVRRTFGLVGLEHLLAG
jgi:anti-anti-sigma factor